MKEQLDENYSVYLKETSSAGHPNYRSPELLDLLVLKTKSDNWSIGMLVIASLFPDVLDDACYKAHSKIYRRAKIIKTTLEDHKIEHQKKLDKLIEEVFESFTSEDMK